MIFIIMFMAERGNIITDEIAERIRESAQPGQKAL